MRFAIIYLMACAIPWLSDCQFNHLAAAERSANGLLALYDFTEGSGETIRNRGGSSGLDLQIESPRAIRWTDQGLQVVRAAQIRSKANAKRLTTAIARSREVTVEAWFLPANDTQAGPARIVTLSQDSSNRNLTLGQDQDRFDVRMRSASTDRNGLPSLASGKKSVAAKQLTHVVFTRDRQGRTRIYRNGEQVSNGKTGGSLANWNDNYRLWLANEAGGGRPWLGTFRLVAIFHRSLSQREVENHFRLGPMADTESRASGPGSDVFVERVAPLLAEHCLECHDAVNKKGGLDLSRKKFALQGGDSGQILEPGKAADSLLVQFIEGDDMPLDRTPLTAAEKQIIRTWIDSGASWTMDFVDPALFVHGSGDLQGASLWIQRLTVEEYIATVQTTLGVDIEQEARKLLPRDLRADGFANTAYNLSVDLEHIEAYADLAEQIASQIDGRAFAKKFTNRLKFTDKDVGALIESMGKWILRGPLSKEEVIVYRGISTTVAASGGKFEEAVQLLVEAMLQSPRFLYRVEHQRGDGSRWPVDEYELASRLSYILWGSSPDERLFQAAESGQLFDEKKFDAEVDRMLDDPRFARRAEQFIAQWLNLDALDNLQPNAERFPHWNAELAHAMQQETKAFFRHVAIEQARPLTDLLTANLTFVTPELAKHYRLQGRAIEDAGGGLKLFDLTEDEARGGLLTQGSVLTIGGDEASMVTRGLFVLHDLLRGVVKDPPPCVDTTPIATEPGLTQRLIATGRIENEACGGCHSRFEPLAFGLEKFDGLGTYLEQDEHGNQLREDGQVLIPGSSEPIDFDRSRELMQILASSDRVKQSLTWKVVQFSLGRPLTAADAANVADIHAQAMAQGGTYRSLMKALVGSDLVRTTLTSDGSQSQMRDE